MGPKELSRIASEEIDCIPRRRKVKLQPNLLTLHFFSCQRFFSNGKRFFCGRGVSFFTLLLHRVCIKSHPLPLTTTTTNKENVFFEQ